MKVELYSLDINAKKLGFVVIQAKYQGKWIFVRHKNRTTWEISGGHIEAGESPDIAAIRELKEETGALDYQLIPVCNYSVDNDGIKTFGRLYYADIYQLGELEYEIEEIALSDELLSNLTYNQIQPYLFDRIIKFINDEKL